MTYLSDHQRHENINILSFKLQNASCYCDMKFLMIVTIILNAMQCTKNSFKTPSNAGADTLGGDYVKFYNKYPYKDYVHRATTPAKIQNERDMTSISFVSCSHKKNTMHLIH